MQRAVFDLGCAAQGLMLYQIDGRTKVVTGCGRRLVYVVACEPQLGRGGCTWLIDSPSSAQVSWPSGCPSPSPVRPQLPPAGTAPGGSLPYGPQPTGTRSPPQPAAPVVPPLKSTSEFGPSPPGPPPPPWLGPPPPLDSTGEFGPVQ